MPLQSSLTYFAARGDVEAVRAHLDGPLLTPAERSADRPARNGLTPLGAACARGHVECASLLLDAGANVNLSDTHGNTPLHSAAIYGEVGCAKLLLSRGADYRLPDMNSSSALCVACTAGHHEFAEVLLRAGADVDRGHMTLNVTPLHVASVQGHLAVAQVLCYYGATRAPKKAPSAADLARDEGRPVLADWLTRTDGWTRLHYVEHPILSADCARELLRGGASVHAAAGSPPRSPLELAQQHPASEAASVILAGARPWSPATHSLYPAAARARAAQLCRIGYLLAWSERFQTESRSLVDAWAHRSDGPSVLALAVSREP